VGQDRRTGRGRGGYRLVASDLDGTLLGPDGEVSARTRAVLRRLGEAGITVVVVTGRPPRWIRGLLDDDVVHELVICANGAVVYDPGADRVVTTDPLPAAVAARLVARLRERAPGVTFAVETGEELRCELQHPLHGGGPGGTGDALDLVRGPVCKLIAHAPDGRVEALHALAVELAGEEAVATVSGFELVEISAAGVTKAFALERLCGELASPPPRSSPSATCPTTCRCSPGPATGWPWGTRTRRSWRAPTRSPRPTPTTASRRSWSGCFPPPGDPRSPPTTGPTPGCGRVRCAPGRCRSVRGRRSRSRW